MSNPAAMASPISHDAPDLPPPSPVLIVDGDGDGDESATSSTPARHALKLTALLAAIVILSLAPTTHAQLIPGIDEWAESTVASGKSKWVGQRVPFPDPSPRPASIARVRSSLWPLTVHVTQGTSRARAEALLSALESAYALYALTGFTSSFGDGGQGGTADHDVYSMASLASGVDVQIDATEPVSGLDGARAFARVDARVPMANLEACAAQALGEALFMELDPAEAPSVRKSSAAYLAYLATGRMGCDDDAERAEDVPYRAALDSEPSARGARWLSLLEARENRQTGVFLREMWQFSRQYTWDGAGLRGSPDLFEAIAKAIDLRLEKFEDVAAEVSVAGLLALREGPIGAEKRDPRVKHLLAEVAWNALPAHIAPADPAIEPLGSAYLLVHTKGMQPFERLRVWSRGEYGVRWALTAVQLDVTGETIGRVRIPTRDNPNGFLVVELDPRCDSVLVAITNMSDGVPDADVTTGNDVRSVAFMLDR